MMDVYQIVLANTSLDYNYILGNFDVILVKESSMYYSNKAFSGVLRGAGGRHV